MNTENTENPTELIWEGTAQNRTSSTPVRVVLLASPRWVISSLTPQVFVEVPFTDKLGVKSWREIDDNDKTLWRTTFASTLVGLRDQLKLWKQRAEDAEKLLDEIAPGWDDDSDND